VTSRQKRSARFSTTIPSAPAKNARTMDTKCRSSSVSFSCQSVRSAERSISSAVQKDATCCLYMDQRSACSRGNSEKRDPSSSVLQIGSMNGLSVSCSVVVMVVAVDVAVGLGICCGDDVVSVGCGVQVDVLPPRADSAIDSSFGFDSIGRSSSWPSLLLLGRMCPPRN